MLSPKVTIGECATGEGRKPVDERLAKIRITTLLLLICVGAGAQAVYPSSCAAAARPPVPIDAQTFEAAAVPVEAAESYPSPPAVPPRQAEPWEHSPIGPSLLESAEPTDAVAVPASARIFLLTSGIFLPLMLFLSRR